MVKMAKKVVTAPYCPLTKDPNNVRRAAPDLLVRLEPWAPKAHLVPKDLRDPLAAKALVANVVWSDRLVHQVHAVIPAPKVLKVKMEES